MKRIIICSVLFLGAIAASCYSYFMVENLNEGLNLRIDALINVLQEENAEEIIAQTNSLVVYWNEKEPHLMHFVRHSHIDVISVSMSRLPAIAEYSDYSEVYAELLSVRRQMEQIREAEQFTLDNLL